ASYSYTITKSPVGTPFQIANLDLHNALSPVGTAFQIANTDQSMIRLSKNGGMPTDKLVDRKRDDS
ncbi:MAG: hypothetical protein LHW51_09900, partial [Candidatus Cloacimonetes bacterium]|nr:hypothetical protein [Candidatus Cloacimonadota bacterium]MCK9242586.1 hypothetical protein [Candidatus Cloacimonadota bacterium]